MDREEQRQERKILRERNYYPKEEGSAEEGTKEAGRRKEDYGEGIWTAEWRNLSETE